MIRLIIIGLFLAQTAIAQSNKTEALYQIIYSTHSDSIKVDAYNKLTWQYIFNDKEKARAYLDTTESLALKTQQKFGYNTFLNNKGIFFDVNGVSDSAKIFFEKSLQYSIANNFPIQEQNSLNNLGMYSWNKGYNTEALSYYFKAMTLAEGKLKNHPLAKTDANLNNIGLVYQDMEMYEKAIPYHQKALTIRIKKNSNQGIATSYHNLGICYKNLERYKEAQQSFEKAIGQAKLANDKQLYYRNLESLGQIFCINNDNEAALKLYLESYNRPAEIPFNASALVRTTSNIAELYLRLGQTRKAIEFANLCVAEIGKDNDEAETSVYKILAQIYFKGGLVEKGAFYNDKFYEATTKKFSDKTANALQELETRYETQQKEIKLQTQKAELYKRELKIKQKNTLIFATFGLLLLMAIVGVFIYKQLKLKNQQLVKENELRQALTKIEHQNNLHDQQLAISKDLHDNIGSQLTFIISSLDNLKYYEFTKESLYQKFDSIGNFTRETITDLRDTIWAMNKEEITFEDLKTRTTNFIESAKTSLLGIDFEFIYPEGSNEVAMNSKLGIDVYRIIQEAVNNAVKHAEPSKISVEFERLNKDFIVRISDNGIGVDIGKIKMGNGLRSMRQRAEKMSAFFEMQSSPGGTTIILKFGLV